MRMKLEGCNTREEQMALIGDYNIPSVELEEIKKQLPNINELYQGKEEYQFKHPDKIWAWCIENNYKTDEVLKNPKFFREQLFERLNHINNKVINTISENKEKQLEKNSVAGAIKLEELLGGKQWVDLFLLALEEERYSEKFLDAVLFNSINKIEWSDREKLGLTVGGPSGSGKTTVLNQVPGMIRTENEKGEALSFNIDGDISRKSSQLLRATIMTAIGKGYSGVLDIHSHCSTLEDVKTNLHKTVGNDPNLNKGQPNTFSKIFKIEETCRFLESITIPPKNIESQKVAYVRVVLNSDTVEKMGKHRAFTTKSIKAEHNITNTGEEYFIHPNISRIKESKKYNKLGYYGGDIGSQIAQYMFHILNPEAYNKNIISDLMAYHDTKKNDLIIVSQRIYDNWHELNNRYQMMKQNDMDNPKEVIIASIKNCESINQEGIDEKLAAAFKQYQPQELLQDIEKYSKFYQQINGPLALQTEDPTYSPEVITMGQGLLQKARSHYEDEIQRLTREIRENEHVESETLEQLTQRLQVCLMMRDRIPMPTAQKVLQQGIDGTIHVAKQGVNTTVNIAKQGVNATVNIAKQGVNATVNIGKGIKDKLNQIRRQEGKNQSEEDEPKDFRTSPSKSLS